MNKITEKAMKETTEKLVETFVIKNNKYGASFEQSVDKYGLISALTRMSDKWNRLEHLIITKDGGTEDESLQDTLLDLANYCIMTSIYLKSE